MVKQEFKAKNNFNLYVAVFAFGIMFSSCGGQQEDGSYEQQPVNADFIELKESPTSIVESYPGTIEGTVNVDIRAQVTGYLETTYVKEGQYVQKGQSLFKIKSDVFNEQVNNSKASLQSALAAQANAQIELEKIRPLVQGKVVSDLQLKTAQAQYDATTAQVAQAKSAISSSQLNAAFAIIKAPVSGYIGRIPSRVGNLVTPSDANPLTTLSEIDQVFVYFNLNEAKFIEFMNDRKTDDGMNTVEIIMADGNRYANKGTVEIASGNIDRNTGTIALKAVFPNPDRILRSGGAARIILTKSLRSAIKLPMAGVKDIQDKFFVYVLADSNKVAMKPITINGRTGADYIVKSGVKPGDKIAVNSIDQLIEGVVVLPNIVSQDSLNN
ncbi:MULTISPECIES: efflux RND transporter periplasmic adaptor subunit [Sphingobacterium]|uniref:efflux RND transporter periplasmic adaptor subunit n=1 Tax=Sphingobacterium TaxID=28453 RepID=UPI001042C905|nr:MULTISPECIES: efflux RND transporter periplasmic adaptor subunit [Sphingobacterium]MCW2263062.1 membrane fusion protein (multidrug efflux system) [Sphingobacterium kitahiroshimense]TCR11948.1 membrane fusion protein (multidrug efflux system) [Sphingobacterium sp. JUb78]